ncbi:MAG TPA: agmatinase [Candidatus Limnocylindria bacterium]|nr:agmatinase [Candidatus Limnocylindria bacterium]
MERNVQTFLACDAGFGEADAVLFGAPFDGTTSFRPGARFGPPAIRGESYGLETYSPYSDRDLTEVRVFDGGDLELPFGSAARALRMVEEYAARVLDAGKRFVMLGGEHLVSLGSLRAAIRRYPDLHVVHLDAHTDLREEYIGEELSHSTVMREIWKLAGDGRIWQFGIRSGERHEFAFARAHTHFRAFDLVGFAEAVESMRGKPVYFTLDLDVLDPSLMCGTGTPEAGGVTFRELLDAVLQLHKLDVVAADVMELSPHYDQSGASTAAACKITREIILQIARRSQ